MSPSDDGDGGGGVGVGGRRPSPPLTGMMSNRNEATPVASKYSTRTLAEPLNQ